MIVPVPLARGPYNVEISAGLIDRCGSTIADVLTPGRCVVVTDSNVAPLYADRASDSLKAAGFGVTLMVVPAGETSKSMSQVAVVSERMIEAGLDRSTTLIALGGGVVGDLAGFIAAIYYRGIPLVQMPTTIVAQVDSSIGGKTGVNMPGGKNLIGAFHQPRLVLTDTDVLATLPPRECNEGFAEIIKHAAIRDPEMFEQMNDLPSLIARNVAIKAAIVAEDEFEITGTRALLNFGHTIGHGIEAAAGYGRYLHGEAISLGLVAACRLSVEKSGLPKNQAQRVLNALAQYHLPLSLPESVSAGEILSALRKDKKFKSGAVRFVLLRSLGDAFVSDAITENDILKAIEDLREPCNF